MLTLLFGGHFMFCRSSCYVGWVKFVSQLTWCIFSWGGGIPGHKVFFVMSRPHTSYHQRFEKLINYRFPLLYKCSYGRRYTLFQTFIFCPKIQLKEKLVVVNLIFKARAQAALASIFLYFLLVLLVSSILAGKFKYV